jgi:hypothetical protein
MNRRFLFSETLIVLLLQIMKGYTTAALQITRNFLFNTIKWTFRFLGGSYLGEGAFRVIACKLVPLETLDILPVYSYLG